jgi:DNA helicase II / ATP-dependent DNA helicase PcrA
MIKPNLIWSPYQKAIFQDINKGIGHTIVEARAGAAKTSSIIESFRYLPKGKKTIALAFNKIIQKELAERAPSYVECFTFHSLGLRAIKQRFKNVEIDDYKVFNLAKEFDECKDNYELTTNLCDAVAFCKYGLLDTPRHIDDLISCFGIDTCDLEREKFISIVVQLLGKDKAMTHKIDFNDMCWFPFVYDLFLGQYDFVFVDERQDLNRSQCAMAKKLCKRDGGRIVAVGDAKQELYSWRMSDDSIIEALKEEPTTKTLSLPISYRCPKVVIDLVKPWVSDITCPDDAKQGEVREISLNQLYNTAKPGCFVLSRTNAPLIKICLSFIRQNVRANIRGRDVGKQLNSLIKKSKKKLVPAFLKWLEKWKDDEVETLRAKNINTENVLDRYECLVNLCDELKSLDEVKTKIGELFNDSDEKNIVCLSTVHRAKGLERDDVFLLRWTFRSWFDTVIDSTIEDENMNIAYVGATRAKDRLFLVSKW